MAGIDPVGVGRAHAKAILAGEHAVVYGAPAIAIPVSALGVVATARAQADGVFLASDLYTGPGCRAHSRLAPVVAAIEAAFTEVGASAEQGVHIGLQSSIPHERGLGSSAAVGAAIGRAIADLHGAELDAAQLGRVVQAAEVVAHGRSSGLDGQTVVATAPLWFQRGKVKPVQLGCDFHFVIADSGITGVTAEAVAQVAQQRSADPDHSEEIMTALAEMTGAAAMDLAAGNTGALGARLGQIHQQLRILGVSTPALDTLVEAALRAGALGAKLTGSGLGGCIIALLNSADEVPAVRAALRAAGAKNTWHTKVVPQ